jgi:type II secretory pathway pseudopilin PulG
MATSKPHYLFKHFFRTKQSGFTLVEIMVVVGFFIFMSAGVAMSVGKFSSHINLTNLSYDMAVTMRQAQTYGVSVIERNTASSATCDYQAGYGVEFSSSDNTSYVMFADDPKDPNFCTDPTAIFASQYNRRCGANGDNYTTIAECKLSSEFLKVFKLERGNYISKFCAVKQDNTEDCSGSSGITYMAISFLRPNPEAYIRTSNSVTGSYDVPNGSPAYKEAYVELSTPDGTRTTRVYVSTTGYISPRGAAGN